MRTKNIAIYRHTPLIRTFIYPLWCHAITLPNPKWSIDTCFIRRLVAYENSIGPFVSVSAISIRLRCPAWTGNWFLSYFSQNGRRIGHRRAPKLP